MQYHILHSPKEKRKKRNMGIVIKLCDIKHFAAWHIVWHLTQLGN